MFLCVCVCVCVFGREEKSSKFVQAASRTQEVSFFIFLFLFYFLVWRVPGAFYNHDMDYEAAAQGPPPPNGPGWG